MKLALSLALMFASFPAFAAALNMSGVVQFIVALIVIAVVFGILYYLADKAPFIPAPWKEGIKYVILFLAAIMVINFLLGLIGKSFIGF